MEMTVSSERKATVTLPTDKQILITREFDAPRHLVWRAWTEPDLIRRWWHAERGEVRSVDVDLRVGGAWRFVMVATGGMEVGFHGEYRDIVEDERLVHTEIYEGFPDAAALTSITFDESEGRTFVTMLVEHELQEHRDAHIASGMEDGLQDALRLLEDVANSLR
jgi:uncharacterized protein YndB with AHSA1/START domain